MRGRPKLTDSRDNQYRVRLNDEENEMLDYASKTVGKPKAEIFRAALVDYYHNVRLHEFNRSTEEEDEWEYGGISLSRVVQCPHCGASNRIDLSDECDISTDERQMGPETLYEFNIEVSCDVCDKQFEVAGYISEYPAGALNNEEIRTAPV